MSLKKLGRYDLLRVVGKGAMGLVYEGRDPNLDRRVAIKTIKVENLSEEAAADYEARFRTEARSAARLQHPNIVSVYDSDRDGDMAFLVMEFIQGEDLKHHLDQGERYSLEQSLGIIRDLLSALDYAHRQNIVHRDIKPANLLIEASGRIKLTDFGVARIQDSGEATRTQGAMVGTLKYMSPEQVQGQSIDARADLFSAGIVLYQLITGTRPFDGDNDFAVIHQIIHHTPAAPSSFNPQLPPEIDAVVAKALAKERENRFASAQAFALALQAATRQASDPTIVPPVSLPRRDGNSLGSTMQPTLAATPGLASSGTSGTASSTVTQELELVYWKDIKDSEEPQDLDLFLAKFPTGIYADLARRRLGKLRGLAPGEELGAVAGTEPAASALDDQDAATITLAPTARLSAQAAAGVPVPGPQTSVPSSAPPRAGTAPLSKPRMAMLVLVGLGVLAVAAIGFKLSSGKQEPVPAVAVSAAPAAGAPASPTAEPDKPAKTPMAARIAAALTPGKAAPKPAAVAVSPAPTDKPVTPKPAAKAAVPVTAEAAHVPAAAATPASPKQACEDRILLGYLTCMAEQCARPVFQNHPLCVERRAMEERSRQDEKIR
jgi:serine/threonine protein kinase